MHRRLDVDVAEWLLLKLNREFCLVYRIPVAREVAEDRGSLRRNAYADIPAAVDAIRQY